jgi:phosphinothricin acetyltransferase
MRIRTATPEDVGALQVLRNYYIANSLSTFDEQPLTRDAIDTWFRQFRASSPHQLLVAVKDGDLLGFCGSQSYRAHPAFSKTVETSIYVSAGFAGRGLGTALYEALFAALAEQPIHRLVVGIALPNAASVALHEKVGFTKVGVFNEYACKHGKFISSQWMERPF